MSVRPDQAMKVLGVPNGSIGVIGGAEVFALFLDRYDTFYLTRAPGVQIPGGQPVFPEVPRITPEDVLSQHGLSRGERQVLDAKSGLVVVSEVTPRGYRVMVLCLTVSYENARTKSLSLWFEPLNSTRRANRLAPRADRTV